LESSENRLLTGELTKLVRINDHLESTGNRFLTGKITKKQNYN
jgi:hypothetical protein